MAHVHDDVGQRGFQATGGHGRGQRQLEAKEQGSEGGRELEAWQPVGGGRRGHNSIGQTCSLYDAKFKQLFSSLQQKSKEIQKVYGWFS